MAGTSARRSTVSVFVPCYNYGRYLRDCVHSILSQPGVDVSVLVIDDCSTDDTPDVAAELAAADSRVQWVRHERNIGHIATYNEGIDWAQGDYTVLLSADDLLTAGALRRAAALLDAHPEAGFAYGGTVRFRPGAPLPPARTASEAGRWRVVDGERWMRAVCRLGANPIHSPEVMVRTSVQRQLGGYRAELPHSGDLEMWLRFATVARVGRLLDSDQAYYRFHDANMQHSYGTALTDLRHVQAAFDTVLAERGDRLAGAESVRRIAHRALARRALRLARSALDAGRLEWQGTPVDELAAYAARLHDAGPPAAREPAAVDPARVDLGLRWRLRLGPSGTRLLRPAVSLVTLQYPRTWLRYRMRRFRAC
jgi:glycosyltransferase involved in cell wall biosynthesis